MSRELLPGGRSSPGAWRPGCGRDREDSQGADRHRRRALHRPPAAPAARPGRPPGGALRRLPRRADPGLRRRRRGLRPATSATLRRPDAARHRRRHPPRPAAPRRELLHPVRRLLPDLRPRRGAGRLHRLREVGAHDRLPQPRAATTAATSNSRLAASASTTRRSRRPAMHHIDYGLGLFRRSAFAGLPEGAAADLADALPRAPRRTATSPASRSPSASTRSAPSPASPTSSTCSPPTTGTPMTFASAVPRRSDADHRRARRGGDRARRRRCSRTVRARGGRLFILGVGGSAGNASHAVNDFRKIVGIEAYAPTDNVSELTARTNDDGWATIFVELAEGQPAERPGRRPGAVRSAAATWRRTSAPTWSPRVQHAKEVGATVIGIVGKDGGYTATVADACVIIPTVNADHITPHAEAFQARGLAPAGVAPRAQGQPDQVGIGAVMQGRRAVFLDRDGVLNRAVLRGGRPYPAAGRGAGRDPAAAAGAALARLKARRLPADRRDQPARRGARHPDAARASSAINAHLAARLPLDEFVVCYHDGDHAASASPTPACCSPRRARWGIDLAASCMVGDR